MSKNTKIVIIAAVVILIIIGICLYVRSKNKSKGTSDKSNSQKVTTPKVFPLIIGSKGDLVKGIQKKLNYIDPTVKLDEDGIIGEETAGQLKIYADYPLTEKGYNTLMSL